MYLWLSMHQRGHNILMGLLYQVTLPGMKQRNMPISKLSLYGDLGQAQAGGCSDEYVHLCMSLFHLHSVVPTFHLEYGMFVSTPRSPYTDSITFCRAQYALQVSFQVLHQPTECLLNDYSPKSITTQMKPPSHSYPSPIYGPLAYSLNWI